MMRYQGVGRRRTPNFRGKKEERTIGSRQNSLGKKKSEEVSEDSMCGALNLSLVQDSHLPFSLPPPPKGSCPNFFMTNVEEISTR